MSFPVGAQGLLQGGDLRRLLLHEEFRQTVELFVDRWNNTRRPKTLKVVRRFFLARWIIVAILQFAEVALYLLVLCTLYQLSKNVSEMQSPQTPVALNSVLESAGLLAAAELMRAALHTLKTRILSSIAATALKTMGAVVVTALAHLPTFPGALNTSARLLFDCRQLGLRFRHSHMLLGGVLRAVAILTAASAVCGPSAIKVAATLVVLVPSLSILLHLRQRFRGMTLSRGELRRRGFVEMLSGMLSMRCMRLEQYAHDRLLNFRTHELKPVSTLLRINLVQKVLVSVVTPVFTYFLLRPFVAGGAVGQTLLQRDAAELLLTPAGALFIVVAATALKRTALELAQGVWNTLEAASSFTRIDALIAAVCEDRPVKKGTRAAPRRIFIPEFLPKKNRVRRASEHVGKASPDAPVISIAEGLEAHHHADRHLLMLSGMSIPNPRPVEPSLVFRSVALRILPRERCILRCPTKVASWSMIRVLSGDLALLPRAERRPSHVRRAAHTPDASKEDYQLECEECGASQVFVGAHAVRGVDSLRETRGVVTAGMVGKCMSVPWIVNDTVRENITLTCTEVPSDAELNKILRFVGLSPQYTLDSELPLGGASISSENLERLGLARTLAAQPSLIVFDGCLPQLPDQEAVRLIDDLLRGDTGEIRLSPQTSFLFVGTTESLWRLRRVALRFRILDVLERGVCDEAVAMTPDDELSVLSSLHAHAATRLDDLVREWYEGWEGLLDVPTPSLSNPAWRAAAECRTAPKASAFAWACEPSAIESSSVADPLPPAVSSAMRSFAKDCKIDEGRDSVFWDLKTNTLFALRTWLRLFAQQGVGFAICEVVLHVALAGLEYALLLLLTLWTHAGGGHWHTVTKAVDVVLIFWTITIVLTDCVDKAGGRRVGARTYLQILRRLCFSSPRGAHTRGAPELGEEISVATGRSLDALDLLSGYTVSIVLYFAFRFIGAVVLLLLCVGASGAMVVAALLVLSITGAIPSVARLNSRHKRLSAISERVLSHVRTITGGKMELSGSVNMGRILMDIYELLDEEATLRRRLYTSEELSFSMMRVASTACSAALAVVCCSVQGVAALRYGAAGVVTACCALSWQWKILSGFFLGLPSIWRNTRAFLRCSLLIKQLPAPEERSFARMKEMLASLKHSAQIESVASSDVLDANLDFRSSGDPAYRDARTGQGYAEGLGARGGHIEDAPPRPLRRRRWCRRGHAATAPSTREVAEETDVLISTNALEIEGCIISFEGFTCRTAHTMLAGVAPLRDFSLVLRPRAPALVWAPPFPKFAAMHGARPPPPGVVRAHDAELAALIAVSESSPASSTSDGAAGVGASGAWVPHTAGTELIIPALLGMFDASQVCGAIRLDGESLAHTSLALERHRVFCIPAAPRLLFGDVHNLVLPYIRKPLRRKPRDATAHGPKRRLFFPDEVLDEALDKAGYFGMFGAVRVSEAVKDRLRFGRVKAFGANLSVPQRQALMLARALVLGCRGVIIEDCGGQLGADLINRAIQLSKGATHSFSLLILTSRADTFSIRPCEHRYIMLDGRLLSV
eukprot:gnl/Chilomastix_cuspidata/3672.p1 GENE.gnl/Chilomastix_cuspidata/3672~~gnl/Chilomastix_cuspidata/3672.p1  ORF type:complete len:1549 (+),score=338.13 gnl/Chilomastix_cuspidata/3672:85-4731(+)